MARYITLCTAPARNEWFRELTPRAQHLYLLLERSEDISQAGVMAWWPGRILSWASGWTEQDVAEAVNELSAAGVVMIDGQELWLVKQICAGLAGRSPKLRTALARAVGKIVSGVLRAAVIAVLRTMAQADPAGWVHPEVVALLGMPVSDTVPVAAHAQADTVSDTVSQNGSDTVSKPFSPADLVPPFKKIKKITKGILGRPAPQAVAPVPRAVPADYRPSSLLVSWAIRQCPGVDVGAATAAFVAHNIARANTWPDVDVAWQGWMSNAHELAQQRAARARRRGPVSGGGGSTVTPTPPPVADRLALLGRAEDRASEQTRALYRTGWRNFAPA